MKFLGVVPARSCSQSIKKKNTFIVNKKPLIQYTLEELNKSLIKEKYLLSDDLRPIKDTLSPQKWSHLRYSR